MHAPLIINPASGRGAGRKLQPAVSRYLAELGLATEVRWSRTPGDVAVQVRQALATHPDVVIIVGGDGTVHEAVNGWMQAGGGAPLAVVPTGTGNDFMKMLDTGSDWREACRLIAGGHNRQVDVGRCNDFYFANGVGIGFDAQVAMQANRMQWLRSNAVYGVALLQTLLLHHQTPVVRVRHDGVVSEGPITLIAVNNGRVEGGAFVLAPTAEINDGLLDVVVARGMSRLGILTLVPRVLRGTHLSKPGVSFFRSSRLVIESDSALPVHADGEIRYTNATRLDIEILPARLTVIA